MNQAATKKIPTLRYPEFYKEWQQSKLKNITTINQGLQIAISERKLEKVPNSYFYITNEFLKEGAKKQYYIVNPPKSVIATDDDLLMTRTGNTGIVVTGVSGAFHNNFFKIKRDESKVTKDFLYIFLKLWSTRKMILRFAGTSTIPDLNHSDFYRIPIMLPPIAEQEKIASFLSSIDKWFGNLREQKKSLEKYKKVIMQKIFSQEIRFKDNNGKDFPEWEEKKICNVLKIGSGKDYKHLGKGNVPVFGTGGYMLSVNKAIYSGESVFIGRKGTIDKPFYFNGDFWTVDTLFYTHSFEGITPKFTYLIFQKINWRKYNEASGVPSLSKTTIEKIKIILPSLQEQQEIADFLSSIDNLIVAKQNQITQAEEWKKGLMQQMFV